MGKGCVLEVRVHPFPRTVLVPDLKRMASPRHKEGWEMKLNPVPRSWRRALR